MIGAIATATEMQNHFGKYLNMILNGNYDLEQERNSKLRKNMRLLIDVNILIHQSYHLPTSLNVLHLIPPFHFPVPRRQLPIF